MLIRNPKNIRNELPKNKEDAAMLWNMNYLGVVIFYAVIFPVVSQVEGAGECRTQKLLCYDCDSRYDPTCKDPFNYSMPYDQRPNSKPCHGCCLKFIHRFPDGEWIQRGCTENIIINYFMVDHVCMSEGKGHGQMCFCESNLCNDAPPNNPMYWQGSSHHLVYKILATCLTFSLSMLVS